MHAGQAASEVTRAENIGTAYLWNTSSASCISLLEHGSTNMYIALGIKRSITMLWVFMSFSQDHLAQQVSSFLLFSALECHKQVPLK